MKLIDIYKRVWKYGLSGVMLWARLKLDNLKMARFYRQNAKKYPMTPARGITLIGDVSGRGSLSMAFRDFALSLHDAGIPLQVFCPGWENDPPKSEVAKLLTSKADFRINRYSMVIDMFNGLEAPIGIARDTATIVFWEYVDGFRQVYPSFVAKQHVLGMSDFVVDVLRRELPDSVKVSKVLYPFRPVPAVMVPRDDVRRRFHIPLDAFAVFYNFNFGSGFGRKNPDGAIRAFAQAFADDDRAFLVFKTLRSKDFPAMVAQLRSLAAELGIGDRLLMLDDFMNRDEIFALTRACDVYLSLHRGEGFGLGIAEAMSLGVPVVVSDFSATTEFCRADNAVLVPCRLVKVPVVQDHLSYTYVTQWAEPDIAFAANALKRLRTDTAYRTQLGSAAQAFIADYFSIDNFRKSINALLDE